MKKMYLMKGMAALAMGLVAVSCNKLDFSGQPEVSKEDAIANAEMQLGLTIDPNQDWKMTKEVKAIVGVKLGTGDDYTLLIYDKNPFAYDDAVYLAKQAVKDGEEVNLNITMPSGQTMVYLVALDSKKQSTVRRALVTEGAISAVFTAEANAPALRRANSGVHQNATSEGINANANEWADPTPGKTFGGWVVPDPLTDDQIAVVKAYFQQVPNLTYQDPGFYHFFVQQVYKGGTDPGTLGNKEVNKAANGTTYASSQMNKLTVGSANLHMNNFNSADCSSTTVLDKGYTANDCENHHHSDKIMLMVNIEDTGCMGYLNSGSSQQRNDKAGLVGWETIRNWANDHNLDGDCLNDGWNRSFVGFDFELYSKEDSYAKSGNGSQLYAPISDIPGNAPKYVWTGTEIQKIPAQSAPRRTKANRARRVSVGDVVPMNEEVKWAVPENFSPTDGQTVNITNAAGTVILGTLTFHGTGGSTTSENNGNGFSYYIERPSVSFKANYALQQAYFIINGPWAPFYCTDNDGYFSLYGTTYNGGNKNGEMNLSGNVQAGHTYTVSWDGSNVKFWGFKIYHYGNLTVTSETIGDGTGSSDNSGNNNNNNNNDNNGNNNNGNDNTQTQSDADLNTYVSSQYIVVNGEEIPYLDANMNMYGGIQKSLADADMKITKNGKECLNLPKFKELVDSGYLPVEDKNLRTWVKWQGGDGYFSDWIVTLSEAERIGDQEIIDSIVPPQRPTIWSYAFEDTWLGDYDMNDVVLKATEDDENITLTLVAAGATLDLNIRLYDYDESGENGYGSHYETLTYNGYDEIHDMLNVDHGTMVNTGGNSANVSILPTFTLSKSEYDPANLRLAIYSVAQGEVRLSGSGDTPYGVLIPYDWSWPTERTKITRAYNQTNSSEEEADQSFSNFASNAGHAEWWFKYPTGSVMK